MNTPEFRLLLIWQCVIEKKKVRSKMLAYLQIAVRVGISERNVRENIKKLVEQGYLVEKDNWYALNYDCDFIKYVIKDYWATEDPKAKEPAESIGYVSEPTIRYHFVPGPRYEVTFHEETKTKFQSTFGSTSIQAMDFFEKEILKNI